MSYKQYITDCIDIGDEEELALSWFYLGAKEATAETKVYTKDSLYLIKANTSPLNFQLFWCNENFIGNINWPKVSVAGDAQRSVVADGITTECFSFLGGSISKDIQDQIETLVTTNTEVAPFSKYNTDHTKDIIIDDDMYYQITQVIGQPYVTNGELEYNKQAICKLAIEPALRAYFTYYPLIVEDQVRVKGNYDILYPEMAYGAVGWVTSNGRLENISPLAALGSMAIIQGGAGRTISGSQTVLQYRKPVPGYTGYSDRGGSITEMASMYPLANTLRNMTKREKLSRIHKEDGLHAIGYSNIGGVLNIKWYCWSRDCNQVEFEDWEQFIALAQAGVKKTIGAIRALLKEDSNVPFDAKSMKQEGTTEWNEIIKAWKESPNRLKDTPMRGGMV